MNFTPQELTKDFRRVMEPFTASNIRARPKNVMKDFVHVAGLLHVTHMVSFTKTDLGPYVKLARFPRGPTLTFKVDTIFLRSVDQILKLMSHSRLTTTRSPGMLSRRSRGRSLMRSSSRITPSSSSTDSETRYTYEIQNSSVFISARFHADCVFFLCYVFL